MINIIKSDWYRIFKGKAIYISIMLLFFFIALSSFELSPGYIGLNNSILGEDGVTLTKDDEEALYKANSIIEERNIMKKYPYKLDKSIVGANANLYYIFIVIVVIVLAIDFSNSTIKNTISSSISRKKYYVSKLINILLLCTLLIILNNFGAYFINLIINGKPFSSSIKDIALITISQLPLMYGIISLLILMSVSIRKTSIFNAVSITFLMVFQLVLMAIITLFKINTNIFNFEYQLALTNLANNPTNMYVIKSIILGITYIIIFNIIGYNIFKKTEIK